MATSWADVIANSAMVFIDDVRLKEQLQTSPALFYRRMSLYVENALPLLSRPPELITYLNNGLTKPTFADFEWVSTDESTSEETQVQTNLTGYDLFSCVIREDDGEGNITLKAYPEATYNSETGVVTFPVQDTNDITYMMDFYSDGSFEKDFSPTVKRLLGLAIAIVWDTRFERTWLNLTPKIHDSSFETVNEANYTDKANLRLRENRLAFEDELRKFEQDNAYYGAFSVTTREKIFI